MTTTVKLSPEYFPNPDASKAIGAAQIYVGTRELDPEVPGNQITVSVLQEDGTLVPVAQPIETSAGGVPLYNGSPVTLTVEGDYSLKVLDMYGSQLYYVPYIPDTGVLYSWEDDGSAFLPLTPGLDIGSATQYVGDIYIGDDYAILFGDDQDAAIGWESVAARLAIMSDFEIYLNSGPASDISLTSGADISLTSGADITLEAVGDVIVNAGVTGEFMVNINSIDMWGIDATGQFLPGLTNPDPDIGSYANPIENIYMKPEYTLVWGASSLEAAVSYELGGEAGELQIIAQGVGRFVRIQGSDRVEFGIGDSSSVDYYLDYAFYPNGNHGLGTSSDPWNDFHTESPKFYFATDDVEFEDALDTGGLGLGTLNGYMEVTVGAVTRYIRLYMAP